MVNGFLAIGVEENISLCEAYSRFDILSRKAGRLQKEAWLLTVKMAVDAVNCR